MFKIKFFSIGIIIFFCAVSFTACNGDGGKQFSTKEDSLSFARSVMEKYPATLTTLQDSTPAKAQPFSANGMQPISWDTVVSYRTYYDKYPLIFNPQKQPYKGFSIDATGYTNLLSNPAIKGLYLRLGRKGDGSYTIMVLGADSAGNILQTDAALPATSEAISNFDNVAPCPDVCPRGDN